MKSISDELWIEIEKVLPEKESLVGRPEMCPRKAFDGIFFVLQTGIQWHNLPEKYGKVGLTIRGLRIRDGLTQKELTKKLNIYQTHISQIEHGRRIVGKNLAQKLAKIFRTDYRLFL